MINKSVDVIVLQSSRCVFFIFFIFFSKTNLLKTIGITLFLEKQEKNHFFYKKIIIKFTFPKNRIRHKNSLRKNYNGKKSSRNLAKLLKCYKR